MYSRTPSKDFIRLNLEAREIWSIELSNRGRLAITKTDDALYSWLFFHANGDMQVPKLKAYGLPIIALHAAIEKLHLVESDVLPHFPDSLP